MQILVPIDDELFAHVILEFLVRESWPEKTVFRVMHVMSPVELMFTWPNEAHRKAAEKLVAEVAAAFKKSFPDATIEELVLEGPPGKVILQEAVDMPADLIVMGSHARSGLARKILGSVSHEVAIHCRCPLAVVRPQHPVERKVRAAVATEEVIFEGEPMTARHRTYLLEHMNDHSFPLDGSDWSRLIQMRLRHEHEKGEPACDNCLDFLDKIKSSDRSASHERCAIQAALRHWFLAGTAPLDEHGNEKRVDQILRTLAASRTPMTPEEAEKEWLSKRSHAYSTEGKYWVSQQGEAFESGNQLPARLEKRAIANRVHDDN